VNWTEEQVIALAPDPSASKSGRELASASRWVSRWMSERALWGECRGSGSIPYRTQIEIRSTAFKCSCPSRKFPCKHGLGLFLMFVRDPGGFIRSAEPDWVTEWLEKREQREQKRTGTEEPGAALAAKAKRAESRLKKVKGGIVETQLWLKDLLRNGLVSIPENSHSFWQSPAARMVDAQAPGIANMIRNLGDINYFTDGWQSELLEQLLKIYLLTEGFRNIDSLPPLMQEDVRSLAGFTKSQDELKASEGVKDCWQVLGRQIEREQELTVYRTWLYGTGTKRFAMVLQFVYRNQHVETGLIPGTGSLAELVFFPGTYQLRAIVKHHSSARPFTSPDGLKDWSEAEERYASVLASFPWLDKMPMLIKNITPIKENERWLMKDAGNKYVALKESYDRLWHLLSCSGGEPADMFVIREKNSCTPLGMWHDQQYRIL
jgi:hypothetical protein